MSNAMISQPTEGLSSEEIREAKYRGFVILSLKGYSVINTSFSVSTNSCSEVNTGIGLLSLTLGRMSLCDAVIFMKGWETSRTCRIEHKVAEEYGLKIIYE